MFGSNKIRLDPQLAAQAAQRARELNLSLDAYVTQLVEKDVRVGQEEALKKKVIEKMKGLGYMQ